MTPMTIQIRATTAALPPELRTPAAAKPPIVIDPSARKIIGQEEGAAGVTWPQARRAGADATPCCASRASTRRSISCADPLDQPLGHGVVVGGAQLTVSGARSGNLVTRLLVHVDTIRRDHAAWRGGRPILISRRVRFLFRRARSPCGGGRTRSGSGGRGVLPEDQVGRLLGHHHDRRVDVAVGDVRHRRGVHHPQALDTVHRHAWTGRRPIRRRCPSSRCRRDAARSPRPWHPVQDLLVGLHRRSRVTARRRCTRRTRAGSGCSGRRGSPRPIPGGPGRWTGS